MAPPRAVCGKKQQDRFIADCREGAATKPYVESIQRKFNYANTILRQLATQLMRRGLSRQK
jgi:hypothetical protein